LTYGWADKGTRPPAPRDCRYSWAYIFGAVCPARGTGAAMVLPYADKPAMTLHLAEIGRNVTPGAHAVVIADGAGWHKPGGNLQLPENVSMLLLPACSPELNPQENIWQYLRQNYLSNRVFATYQAIVDACCAAWKALMDQPARVTTIATRQWAKAVTV
jgi:transposase